ncbi:MAG: sodium/proton-translocating pyrophosphatase [Deltaproteobacteria bacterium]|nr:sodium/proton-translocating pyrophosphatase [Deltaproteobacteria bacterium]
MIELSVVCLVSVVAFALAFVGARALLSRPLDDDALVSAGRTLGGGVARFVRRQHVVVAALAAVVVATLVVTYGVAYQAGTGAAASHRVRGLSLALGFVVGAGLTLFVSWVASAVGVAAVSRAASSGRRSLDESLSVGLRIASLPSLVAQALGCFALGAGALALYAFSGGLRGDRSRALAALVEAPGAFVGVALGGAVVGALTTLAGTMFGRTADFGADVAGQLEGGLPEDSVRNPATLADLVGDQVGDAVAVGSGALRSMLVEVVVAMLVAVRVFREEPSFPSFTALVFCPLVLRATAALAGWVGVVVVRTDDTETPLVALRRGLFVSGLLVAVAGIGTATWLLGGHARAFGGCVALGVVSSVAMFLVAERFGEARTERVGSMVESARRGPSLFVLRGYLHGVDQSLATLLIVALGSLAAHRLGVATGLRGGPLLALALFMSGMRASAGMLRAMAALGTASDGASGLLAVTLAGERPDVQARARTLAGAGAIARTCLRASDAVTAVLVAGLVVVLVHGGAASSPTPPSGDAWLAWVLGSLAGCGLVLVFGRVVLGGLVTSCRELVDELGYMLREDWGGERGDRGGGALTGGEFSAVHDACVETVSRSALRRTLAPAAVGLLSPLAFGLVLRLCATGDSVRSSAEAFVAFVSVATIAGGLGSLLLANAGSAWDTAKRYIEAGTRGGRVERLRAYWHAGSQEFVAPLDQVEASASSQTALNPAYAAAIVGDALGDPLRGAVAPAILAILETLALYALALHPLFF